MVLKQTFANRCYVGVCFMRLHHKWRIAICKSSFNLCLKLTPIAIGDADRVQGKCGRKSENEQSYSAAWMNESIHRNNVKSKKILMCLDIMHSVDILAYASGSVPFSVRPSIFTLLYTSFRHSFIEIEYIHTMWYRVSNSLFDSYFSLSLFHSFVLVVSYVPKIAKHWMFFFIFFSVHSLWFSIQPILFTYICAYSASVVQYWWQFVCVCFCYVQPNNILSGICYYCRQFQYGTIELLSLVTAAGLAVGSLFMYIYIYWSSTYLLTIP